MFFLYEAGLTDKSFNLLSAEIICKCTSIDVSLDFTARHGLREAVQFEYCVFIHVVAKNSSKRIYSLSSSYYISERLTLSTRWD